jgi:hypothetical protein
VGASSTSTASSSSQVPPAAWRRWTVLLTVFKSLGQPSMKAPGISPRSRWKLRSRRPRRQPMRRTSFRGRISFVDMPHGFFHNPGAEVPKDG